MKYNIISYTAEITDKADLSPGCTIGSRPEVIAKYRNFDKAKAHIRQLRSTITPAGEGFIVREYFLYEVSRNGDLSSMDCSDMEGY